MNGKNGVNGQTVIDHVPMVSVSVNVPVARVPLLYVTVPNVTWKSVTKMCAMIGQQKDGQIGQPGAIVQNHVVVVSESAVVFVRTLIIIVTIMDSTTKWEIAMNQHAQSIPVPKNSGRFSS